MRFVFILIVMCSSYAQAQAPSRKFAAGGNVGSIISINGKYWLGPKQAIDFGLGFTGGWTLIYADFLWHIQGLFGSDTRFGRETLAYFGAGGGMGFWSSREGCGRWTCSGNATSGSGLLVRGFFGFEWLPPKVPFGVYAEAGPTLNFGDRTGGVLDILVGGRYYF